MGTVKLVKLTGEYYEDENFNRWSVDKYTEKQAIVASESLKNAVFAQTAKIALTVKNVLTAKIALVVGFVSLVPIANIARDVGTAEIASIAKIAPTAQIAKIAHFVINVGVVKIALIYSTKFARGGSMFKKKKGGRYGNKG